MKIHLLTAGKPRLPYAVIGWNEYLQRLQRFHTVRVTHVADKYAYNERKFHEATRGTYVVVLDVAGEDYSSESMAAFLQKREEAAVEVSFVIGGPEGLPATVRQSADVHWSLGRLTLPHDLAMVVVAEALYRASTINLHLPYHK